MSSERTFPAPEISRYRVGEFAVTVLSDGSLDASLDLLDGIDQDEALSLLGAADTSPSSHMNINAFVIEAGARTILSGGGAGNLNGWGGRLIFPERQCSVPGASDINDFYNPQRLHSAIQWKSPLDYDRNAA